MSDPEDQNVVTVTDPEPAEDAAPTKPARATTAQLLEAIRDLPDAVAAKVKGESHEGPTSSGDRPEVTFVGEPPPEPDTTDEDGEPEPESTAPAPDPEYRRRRGHPSRPRRRVELPS